VATAALELNDAALALVTDGEVVLAGPGSAVLTAGQLRFGNEARRLARLQPRQSNRRFWRDLGEQALAQPLGDCRTAADLVHGQLAALWSQRLKGAESVMLVVPPGWSAAQLGLLLGIARDVGMPVAGLVDSAVAASRRRYVGQALWHVEALLHDTWMTRIEQNGGAAAGTRERVERLGMEALERTCAEFISRRFVEATRFDPLHDAATEQDLFNRLPDVLPQIARREAVDIALEHRGNQFHATVSAASLRESVGRACEPLIQRLRALLPAREPAVLQVHHALAEMPGVLDALSRLPGSTVVALEPAAAARGALRFRGSSGGTADGLRLVTALPWDQPAVESIGSGSPQPADGQAQAPTHLLFEGRAWRLGAAPVQVGSEIGEHEYGIRLDSQGISRRHCTVQVEAGRVLVHDQSRYGTWLNGHRIEGSAVLQAGDVLAIGQPPRELRLVTEVMRGP
jgi:hypothetical protein